MAEEISLVERLEKMGKKQDEIAEMLGSNVTWVSQTSNFRAQLPEEAFAQLLNGTMTRHVAVTLLSYAPEDRPELYQATLKAEQKETEEKIKHFKEEKERLEDEEELLLDDARQASAVGDKTTEAKALRKAASKGMKAEKASEKVEKAKNESGVIKQGHVKKGAAEAGIAPKKAKLLDRHEIEETFVKGILPFLKSKIDPQTGYEIPGEFAGIVRRTAMAILRGSHDTLEPIREYMYDNGIWERPEDTPTSSLEEGMDALDDLMDDEDCNADFDPSEFADSSVIDD
jgi:transcriptional regulator with XRE-family HTH domain